MRTLIVIVLAFFPTPIRAEDSIADGLAQCLSTTLSQVDALYALELCEKEMGLDLTYVQAGKSLGSVILGVTVNCSPTCASLDCVGSCHLDSPTTSRYESKPSEAKRKGSSWSIALE